MSGVDTYSIDVAVQARYIADQSAPDDHRYVFAYSGRSAAPLISRHWSIPDANRKVQEVPGDGVVGEQPLLRPGEHFNYTSGAVIETAVGTMRGSYQMVADDGHRFEAAIAQFTLSIPRTVH